jgi:3'-5' exoribonuclease
VPLKKESYWVRDLTPGTKLRSSFLATDAAVRKDSRGVPFLTMKLVDRTGSVDALMWRLPDELLKGLSSPAYVGVEGQAHEYRGTLQVKVERLRVLRQEEVSEEDYLPTTEKDRRALAEEILHAGRSFENEHVRDLFESMVSDQEFWTAFCEAPAAKGMHHARVGGLLEHSARIATCCSSGRSSTTWARCESSPGTPAVSRIPRRAGCSATWSSASGSWPRT